MATHKQLYLSGRIACELCYSGQKGRRAFPGHCGGFNAKARKGALMARFIGQRVEANGGKVNPATPALGAWAGTYPAICEYMTQGTWPDGTPRETSTLSMFVDAGMWKACFKDRDQGQVLFVSAKTPEQLLQTIETQLATGGAEWRPDHGYGKKNGKK